MGLAPRHTASVVVWPLLIACVGGLVYLNTLGNGFALDDLQLVRDNTQIREGHSPAELLLAPYSPAGGASAGLYRPVTVLSLWLNRQLTGPGPLGFHAGNVLLHMSVCVLLWYLFRAVGIHYGTAFAGALLFAVHPIHTEAVANIVGRAEILAALWVLVSWLFYRRGMAATTTAGALRWVAVSGLAYLLAVLSKENAVLAPALFALDIWLTGSPGGRRRLGWAWIGYAVAFALAILLRVQAIGGLRGPQTTFFIDNPPAFMGAATRVMTALWVQFKYLCLLVWPARLSSDYSFEAIPAVQSVLDPRLWMALGVLSLIAWIVVRRRVSRVVLVGLAAWLLLVLPTANLLFPIGTLMGERLVYAASLGPCLIAGQLIARAAAAPTRRALVIGTGIAVVLALSVRTVQRNPVWDSNETLALADVQTLPRSAKLQAGAGIVLHERGETAAAEQAFRRALEIYPDYAQVRFNLGQLLMNRGAEVEAIEHLQIASRLSPENPRPHQSLAPLLERAGRYDEAIAAYTAATRLVPGDLAGRFNHGRLLLSRNRPAEARAVLLSLARDDPAGLTGNLAGALVHEIDGELAAAAVIYRRLLTIGDLPGDTRRRIEQRLSTLDQ